MVSKNKNSTEEIFQEFAATLVLQVFGGGGAIWGFSEVCGLRVAENKHFWQPTAAIIGFVFWLRWLRQLHERIVLSSSSSSEYWIHTGKELECVQVFTAKLVLEVFGGGGAIWGFSEVTGLRVAENKHFWQPTAAAIGCIFFVRWSRQLYQHYVTVLSTPFSSSSSSSPLTLPSSLDDTFEDENTAAISDINNTFKTPQKHSRNSSILGISMRQTLFDGNNDRTDSNISIDNNPSTPETLSSDSSCSETSSLISSSSPPP